ncbi:HAMP domain-containing histidine kinase [Phycicoccus sp. CSK15P-2]|uniref:sensor histidine kinase n=1 Tax=Phycicoccus sp. CSK15P-2 TaxID=2807627 RepID=UPI00194F8CF2|nr:HAMP domain-containing sensor histidine kinase [Phycicoccus sp. CSK15P-2]MBM6406114.1 HAMP domain-containing histidine kinase [Phycicoccus sp. CSK15P-2]
MRLRPRLRGLRARLVAASALVAMLSVGAAVWAAAASASRSLVDSYERQVVRSTVDQVSAVAPTLTYPPDQESLDRAAGAVGPDAVVTFRDRRSAAEARTALVTDALRGAVRTGDGVVTQRVRVPEGAWLVVGVPVLATAPDGSARPSGVEVFVVQDLAEVQDQLDRMTRTVVATTAVTLPVAVLLALAAAGTVLRPVRRLRDTATRIAAGDLQARSEPRGADELADLTRTVNGMADAVQDSVTRLQRLQTDARRFAADVSHELRTPLSTLSAVVEVLDDAVDDLDEDARESARLAVAETARLVRLVEDLMEVARFDAGTARLQLDRLDVVEAVRRTLHARGWLGEVDLRVPAPDAQVWAVLDGRRLDVIVANLVGNALTHGARPVLVEVRSEADDVVVVVRDSGPGLSADALEHAFDRFSKGDPARSRGDGTGARPTPGSGLGLSLAWESAVLHGGVLTGDNDPEAGARFTLRLPRAGAGS